MSKSQKKSPDYFYTYKHAVCFYGKEVLLKFLKWFYKGGNKSYLDYLSSEYDLSNTSMGQLIDSSREFVLRYTTPEHYDVTLIHVLLQLASHLYDDDCSFRVLEEKVHSLVLESVALANEEYKLTEQELVDRLEDVRSFYVEVIGIASLSVYVDNLECYQLGVEIYFGVKHLFSGLEKMARPGKKGTSTLSSTHDMEEKFMERFSHVMDYDMLKKCKNKYVNVEVDESSIASLLKEQLGLLNKGQRNDKSKMNVTFHLSMRGDGTLRGDSNVSFSKSSIIKGIKRTKADGKSAKKIISKTSSTQVSVVNIEKKKSSGSNTSGKKKFTDLSEDSVKTNMGLKKQQSAARLSSVDASINNIKSATSQIKDENVRVAGAEALENLSESYTNRTKDKIDLSSIMEDNRSRIRKALWPDFFGELETYTDISLKQHQKYSRRPGHLVNLEDFHILEGVNADHAEIIIVSGEAGMGKSWLYRYITERWRDNNDFDGDYVWCQDLLVACQLQKNGVNNFTQLVSSLLRDEDEQLFMPEENLKERLLGCSLLVMLDGYDESCAKSCQLVSEVLQMIGFDLRIVVTCRPQYVESLYRQITKARRKYISHVCLNIISPDHHANFVSGVILSKETVRKDSDQLKKIKEGLINRLPEIYEKLGEDLCNPLMLKIITSMWMENAHLELQSNAQQENIVI